MFYRQSDVPEILELTWILTCLTSKGLMNRAHAYKAAIDENLRENEEQDKGVNMGLYCYPVLMAADILMFNTHKVPVGRDQIQHIEMARDIAQRFNHQYKEIFTLPEAYVEERVAALSGLDGRKMSKSYNNTIPLFCEEKQLRKLIMKIKTDSSDPDEPKDPETSTLFHIYQAFATPEQTAEIRERYARGIGWGEMKAILFDLVNDRLKEPRAKYERVDQEPQGHPGNAAQWRGQSQALRHSAAQEGAQGRRRGALREVRPRVPSGWFRSQAVRPGRARLP